MRNGASRHHLAGLQRGFSLLEVLVAFSILALSMGVLMQIFSGGLRNVGISEDYARAVALAETQLAAMEAEITPGERSGEFGDKFHWDVLVQPLEDNSQSSPVKTQSSVSLMGIAVTVAWQEGKSGARSVTLHSARTFFKAP